MKIPAVFGSENRRDMEQFHKLIRTPMGGTRFRGTTSLEGFCQGISACDAGIDKRKAPGILLNRFSPHHHSYEALERVTGWWAFDIDKVLNAAVAHDLKRQLFTHPNIAIAFISFSGFGVKLIGYWKPPLWLQQRPLDREKVKRYYQGLIGDLESSCKYYRIRWDMSQGRVTQPIWGSCDKKILFKQVK